MKRLLSLLITMLAFLPTIAQDEIQYILGQCSELQQNSGDVAAKEYLVKNYDAFSRNNCIEVYQNYWGYYTSNIWNATQDPNEAFYYKPFLENYFSRQEIPAKLFDYFGINFNQHSQYAYDYASILNKDGEYLEARKWLLKNKEWHKQLKLQSSARYGALLYAIYCITFYQIENYEETIPYLNEYIKYAKKHYGKISVELGDALHDLSACYFQMGNEKKSIKILKDAINVYSAAPNKDEHVLETMHDQLAMLESGKGILLTPEFSLNGAIAAARIAGDHEGAIKILKESKTRIEQEGLSNLHDYVQTILFLVDEYITIGNIAEAQKNFDILSTQIGITNISNDDLSLYYEKAGDLHSALNQNAKAIKYYKLLQYELEKKGDYSMTYNRVLENMAEAYTTIGDYLSAKLYIDEALSAYEDLFGEIDIKSGNMNDVITLDNKAYVYSKIGEIEEAIKTYESILSTYKADPAYKVICNNTAAKLAKLYANEGDCEKVIETVNTLELEDENVHNSVIWPLLFAYSTQKDRKARNEILYYTDNIRKECTNVFTYFAESERNKYWENNAYKLTSNGLFVANLMPENTDIAYKNILYTRNMSLLASDLIKRYVYDSKSDDLLQTYNRLNALKQELYTIPSDSDGYNATEDELLSCERTLVQAAAEYIHSAVNDFPDWSKVRDNLKNDEVAIEFVEVPDFQGGKPKDCPTKYGALIITKTCDLPQLVLACDREELWQNFIRTQENSRQGVENVYNERGASNIYSLIWKQLEPYMSGKKNVYFVPNGVLNYVNHNAIMDDKGKRFGEKYNLIRLSSTSQIINRHDGNGNYKSASLFGGINYDQSVENMTASVTATIDATDVDFLTRRRGISQEKWEALPGTATETSSIYEQLKESGINAKLFQWDDASEYQFKMYDHQPCDILHLSTHGYFITGAQLASENVLTSPNNNMARTGLLFAGANNAWVNGNVVTGMEDGILTAEEISRMDLRKTQLVVLSACETGRGIMNDVEGVLGLQKAFKKAGVQTIVMSLWKVDDEATSILMKHFYECLLAGDNPRSALSKAQTHLQKTNYKYRSPYFWGAFVVLD